MPIRDPELADRLYAEANAAIDAIMEAENALQTAKDQRRAAFVALRDAGESLSSIGHMYDLSKQRVAQIVSGPEPSSPDG